MARQPIVDWAADVALAPDGPSAAHWLGTMPWDDPELYTRRSPIFFASDSKRPPWSSPETRSGSDQLYFALQQRKIESALVRIAGDKPGARIQELEATLAWLK